MPSTYVTEMDNLIVDLDKVLDDFEAEEKASSHFPGQELKPSDFANYVAEKEDKPWEDLSKAPYSSDPTWKLYSNNDKLSTLDYDAPYSPTDFDLSEADFAPSVSTNQKTFFKDSCKNENFVAPELNNHISLNHNGVVENFQHNIDNKYKSKDKTSLQKGHEYDFRNSDEVKSNASNAGVIHSGSELNGVTLDHNITGHVPNSFGTASGNSQKDIKYVHLLASYTDETGCKFPIQARDEFTPVYENQPFPPDLAPALQNRESVHTQLHQIFENSSETYMNDKQQNHKEILMAENNISGKSDLLSAIPGNLYLNSNDSSIDSGLNSMDGQTCASFDTALVNSSQTRPIQNQETKVAVKAPHSYLSNVVTPHSQTGANEKSEQMDTNNKSNLCASNEPEVMDDQTDVKCVSDTTSQMTKDSHNSKGNVVEFGDIGYPVRKEMDDSRGNSEGSEDVTSPMTRGNSDSMVEFVRTGDKTLSVMKDIVDSSVKVEENKSSEVAKDICDSKVDMVGFGDEASSATTEISVVGFGDVNIEVSDTDIDNYLSDAVKDNQNDHKDANIMNERDEVMCNEEMTCNNVDGGEHGYPPLSEMRGDSGHSIGPNHGYCVEPAGQVRTNLHNLPQASEQSHDKTASENEQVKDNQTEVLNIIRPKEAVRPNSLSQPSADSLSSNNTAADSKQGHVSPMEFFYINQSRNESSKINDSEQSEVNISNAELSHVPSASTTEPAKSRQTLAVTEEDMDEDLAAAIALSLKETTNMPSNIEVSNGSSAAQIDDDISDKEDIPVMRRSQLDPKLSTQNPEANRPHSWGPSGSGTASVQQQKRPNSLNLPPRGEFSMGTERSQAPYTFPYTTTEDQKLTDDSADSVENTLVPDVVEDSMAAQPGEVEEASGASGNTPSPNASLPDSAPPSVLHINTSLGKVAPVWIPDSDAPICMGCDSKFTFTKRRHHCRACGKVFCSACCNLKSRLQYMENKEARVCHSCHEELTIVEISSRTGRSPNPNNPSEYCSTIPPTQQVSAQSPPPTVMVPVGVLKREGSHRRGEPKQVMFSDGIRPGGDLTELDGSNEATSRIPHRRSGRSQKKVDRASPESGSRPITRRLKATENQRTKCLIPETGLPPLVLPGSGKGEFVLEDNPDLEKLMPQIKDEEAEPVIFALNTNLQVLVKILSLDCCVNRLCWCFTSKGMCTVGQDEIVIVLETLPDETTIPKDIFCHLHTIYDEAGKGNTVSDMGHTIFNQSFLDSRDHGGFLYIRPTFQCLHKLILPTPPYVFGILLQKWETPWAKVFPIRLLLRLGAEYRYYPCPLISVRNRKPVFFEIGHTIMNLLADFRNYQYMLPQIKGITIHMEDKKTVINFPRNRYDDLMKVVSNSNEHVMAVGAGFSTEADSHLVCIQNDDGNYQTQAINIQNKPRKVTGASFVVFNGALKTSSGLKAKSSIVEDGLMVQISPESMVALKQAMKDMKEYEIGCGSITLSNPDEVVLVQWTREDKNINVGVKSPIDNMAMDGIESIHIPNATDYVGEQKVIRWTDVFFIQNLDSGSTKWEPVDLSRLAETLSNASCIALTQHLQKLKEESLTKIGLRVNIETDKVGYEIGSNGEKLPDIYMNDLDNELIPVIHSAASQNHGGSICLELIFHILD